MSNQHDEPPEYLKTDNPRGGENVEPRELASALLHDLDYDAQIMAIRILLFQHREADEKHTDEIKRLDEYCKSPGHHSERAVDEWVDLLHSSVYQEAAHSMAAVGMLAPLVESMFFGAFYKVREHFFPADSLHSNHPRWNVSAKEQWDCHFFYDKQGKRQKDLANGIMDLADAVGLTPHLPSDLKPTLQALFTYRNRMFHFGLEWPVDERQRFAGHISQSISNEGWSSDWIEKSTSDGIPWIFYLTDKFVDHCLNSIDHVVEGMGIYVEEQLARRNK
ncbi:MAG TPA: hypothetical protein VGP66_11760 [Candidatus Acidoferrum sp.]|jgi:hypothetical protein|nr:hypothetical protein [Candidatus Acidoferrum sp.]